jgi:hypothetical protein
MASHPHRFGSSNVIFTVWADRPGDSREDRDAAWEDLSSEPRSCVRSSDLGKRSGWGMHADEHGRVGLQGRGTTEYECLASRRTPDGRLVKAVAAMRSRLR